MHINLVFRETQIAAYSELRQTSKMKCLKGLKRLAKACSR